MPAHLIGPSEEIVEGRFKIVEMGKRSVGVTRLRGVLYAVLNYCPHAGAPICHGHLTGLVTSDGPGQGGYDAARAIVRCPWHHWEFDLADGRGICAGTGRIKTYPVREAEGQVWIDA
ncbi:MAG: Rieske (2Fe-2S) protein [Rariglobus sp.]|nr:Rieske 2Fe-2S domain-containing protein [Rariglobus sp.]